MSTKQIWVLGVTRSYNGRSSATPLFSAAVRELLRVDKKGVIHYLAGSMANTVVTHCFQNTANVSQGNFEEHRASSKGARLAHEVACLVEWLEEHSSDAFTIVCFSWRRARIHDMLMRSKAKRQYALLQQQGKVFLVHPKARAPLFERMRDITAVIMQRLPFARKTVSYLKRRRCQGKNRATTS